MPINDVKSKLSAAGIAFDCETLSPGIMHMSGPQPAADDFNEKVKGSFMLFIPTFSPHFANYKDVVASAGIQIVFDSYAWEGRYLHVKEVVTE